jgi:hypothetical protein
MKWIAIFQMPVVALLVAVATMITQAAGIYCEYSTGAKPFWFAHFWVSDPLPADIYFGLMDVKARDRKQLVTRIRFHFYPQILLDFEASNHSPRCFVQINCLQNDRGADVH